MKGDRIRIEQGSEINMSRDVNSLEKLDEMRKNEVPSVELNRPQMARIAIDEAWEKRKLKIKK